MENSGENSGFDAVEGTPLFKNTEHLDERSIACFEQFKQDFGRGIVLIDGNGTLESYQSKFKADKTAGQTWEAIEKRLIANGAALLKKAAEMSGGACLIGVDPNGTLVIRQRSSEIMNARWDSEGNLLLLQREAAKGLSGRWAEPFEIIQAVKQAGYELPKYPVNSEKLTDLSFPLLGWLAASVVVSGGAYYLESSPDDQLYGIWCDAVLDAEGPDQPLSCVHFSPVGENQYIYTIAADTPTPELIGAILWLTG